MPISKTDYILWRECPNNVWVKKHLPKEYAKFEVSEFEQSLAEMGNDVEALARGMFPNGYLVEKRSEGAQELTQKLINEHHSVIFQAVFSTDKYLAATDVLQWNEKVKAYDLYEIKMSTTEEEADDGAVEESGKEKPKKVNRKKEDQYENDLAFQVNVLEKCGVKINEKYLVRLNKEYVRMGELDFTPGQLFIIENKTEKINQIMPSVLVDMERAYDFLSKKEISKDPCPCFYKGRSSHCTAFTYLNPHVPTYSVHDLNRIGNSKKYLKELLDEGILTIDKVPEDERIQPKKVSKKGEEERMSKPKKLNQVRAHKTGEPIIDIEAIKAELNSLTFPLYFLDYETYPTAIPPHTGYHPYQHIVFQYSLHVLTEEDFKAGREPKHFEFLAFDGDPAERIVESLRANIGNVGSVISWYKKFENSCNKELARSVPLQFQFLDDVIKRTYDLMDIVENQHYVHPGFMGRSSIKKVLPVLAPDLSYKKLGVQNGTEAIEAYRQITTKELIGKEAGEKIKEMLEYCKLDTYAMYRLWKFFYELVYNKK
jgi:hypothetical protein